MRILICLVIYALGFLAGCDDSSVDTRPFVWECWKGHGCKKIHYDPITDPDMLAGD